MQPCEPHVAAQEPKATAVQVHSMQKGDFGLKVWMVSFTLSPCINSIQRQNNPLVPYNSPVNPILPFIPTPPIKRHNFLSYVDFWCFKTFLPGVPARSFAGAAHAIAPGGETVRLQRVRPPVHRQEQLAETRGRAQREQVSPCRHLSELLMSLSQELRVSDLSQKILQKLLSNRPSQGKYEHRFQLSKKVRTGITETFVTNSPELITIKQ